MDRRTLLLGLLGGLAAAPTIIAAASSAEAAPLPEVLTPTPEPLPKSASPSAVTEADLEGVKADWSQYWRRRGRRIYRRYYRRPRRRFYRRYYRRPAATTGGASTEGLRGHWTKAPSVGCVSD